jgi:hypothetical protein
MMNLGATSHKRNQDLAVLQRHLLTIEENTSHQFLAQSDEMSLDLVDKDQLNGQFAEKCQQHRLQIATLTAELSDKVRYIKKLETGTAVTASSTKSKTL